MAYTQKERTLFDRGQNIETDAREEQKGAHVLNEGLSLHVDAKAERPYLKELFQKTAEIRRMVSFLDRSRPGGIPFLPLNDKDGLRIRSMGIVGGALFLVGVVFILTALGLVEFLALSVGTVLPTLPVWMKVLLGIVGTLVALFGLAEPPA